MVAKSELVNFHNLQNDKLICKAYPIDQPLSAAVTSVWEEQLESAT